MLRHLAYSAKRWAYLGITRPRHDGRPTIVDRYILGPDGERLKASDLLQRFPRSILIGSAGAGKTTLLGQVAADLGERFLASPTTEICPLVLGPTEIGEIAGVPDILEALATLIGSRTGEQLERQELSTMMELGKLFLLADALDEVPDAAVIGRLTDLFRQFPKLQGLVSSRPMSLTANLKGFAVISLEPLDLDSVEALLRARWIESSGLIDRFLDQIARNAAGASILQSPMMTEFMLEIFEAKGALPTLRSGVYQDFVDVSIDREFSLVRSPACSRGELLSLLGEIAQFFSEQQIHEASHEQIATIARKVTGRGAEVVEFLTNRNPTFVAEWSQGRIGFSHRSIEEYFLAWHYRNEPSFFVNRIKQGDRTAVTEFGAGLVSDVSPLVEAAVGAGMFTDAVNFLREAKSSNAALETYVIQNLRRVLGDAFMQKLVGRSENEASHSNIFDKISPELDEPSELLNLLDTASNVQLTSHKRGELFEQFCIRLLSGLFKIVSSRANLHVGEIDIMVENVVPGPFWADFGGDFLVECKNLLGHSPVSDANGFMGKIANARVKLGFIISMNGFTKIAYDALALNASNPAMPLVVPISGADLRDALRTRHELEDFFKTQIRHIKYKYK
ncbi:hypothetical protein J2045_001310 [Peteryoungia aggregata LMG 23059]|uniref:NACHT domain-containing protein n=1 Tax=Peteryoungia aggregata LMG 23059 TaxID=1368425 RepID=A0ABU0G6F4_9HYPH|nr:NACHT domain-containing protein [Peteryoungia aggregata]MDQ0420291.1 hypothetical protein [Peteryoungia aggregata LMG 23059]